MILENKMKLNKIAVAFLATIPTMTFASLGEAGLSGDIAIITGQATEKSNFQTEDNIKYGNLDSEGESDTQLLVAPLGQLRYTFGPGNAQQLFFGSSKDDIIVGDLAVELGYKAELQNGTIVSFALLPTIVGGETWADPFVVDNEREETDIKGNAVSMSFDRILGSGFSAQVGAYQFEVDDEKSGTTLNANGGEELNSGEASKLDRESTGIYSKLSLTTPFNKATRLITSVKYIGHDADGDAMAYDQLGGELSFQKGMGQHFFAITGSYDKASYDDSHPVFSEKRKDDKFGALFVYQYANFLNLADWALIGSAGYSATSSNIDFYDSSQYVTTIGMKYKF